MKKPTNKTVYMAVSKDEYRLPVAIADTQVELARITGSSVTNIASIICKGRKGKILNPRFIAVELDE